MENNIILKALYEQRKLMITQSYKMMKEKTGFSQGYVYSIANDVFPIFHVGHYEDIEIYEKLYKVSKKQIQEFIRDIDKIWLEKKEVGFYDLENKFGGKENRFKLINMLRYCYLDNRFSGEKFWNHLIANGPMESHSLTREFDLMYDS